MSYIQPDKLTDQQLLDLTLKSQDNFLYLMQRYETKLLRYIKRLSNISHEEAEDILQESFIKAYQNINNFDKKLKFSSWIYRIAHNEVISYWRKTKARPQTITWDIDDQILNNISDDFDLNQEVDQKYLQKHLKQILSKLDKKYQEVLILKFLEDKSYKEIAEITGKSDASCKMAFSRTINKLRQEMPLSLFLLFLLNI